MLLRASVINWRNLLSLPYDSWTLRLCFSAAFELSFMHSGNDLKIGIRMLMHGKRHHCGTSMKFISW